MIKFRINKEGRVLLGFGLEKGNVERLQSHDPICFTLEELGEEFRGIDVLIVYGDDKENIKKELNTYGFSVGPQTEVMDKTNHF